MEEGLCGWVVKTQTRSRTKEKHGLRRRRGHAYAAIAGVDSLRQSKPEHRNPLKKTAAKCEGKRSQHRRLTGQSRQVQGDTCPARLSLLLYLIQMPAMLFIQDPDVREQAKQ